MEQYHAEMLAVSLAGHDKGKCYVVLGQAGDFFLLADGKNKLLEQPKRKNQKHVQLIKHIPEELSAQMRCIRDDADIKRILKTYNK